MERISIVKHKEASMVFLDASRIVDIDEFCQYLKDLTDLAIEQNINLIMIDVENAFMAPKVRQTTKQEAQRAQAHFGQVHTAISGVKGLQRVLINLINRKEYFAKDLEDAKSWLISKA